MTIKKLKMIVFFLKQYQTILEKNQTQELNLMFTDFFSREELLDILEHSYFDRDLEEHKVETLENSDLLELIGEDYFLLTYLIDKTEKSITATPTFSEEEKKEFFELKNLETHYLYSKPSQEWDSYDISNYYSLLFKHGKTARVFAIFTSDVESEDKYAVTTKPSFFFDSKEEAETELKKIYKEQSFKKGDLKILSLWKIQ
ncbi:MAG: hypothetical protein COB12_06770 [Flavobacterium sp.]|nr:MAG: hypothetical protein COB12_06770 [Flavobacterium sp.]